MSEQFAVEDLGHDMWLDDPQTEREFHQYLWQAYVRGRAEAMRRVLELWDSEGGWIPGAARERLAEALGVPPERVRTSQQLRADGVAPGYIAT